MKHTKRIISLAMVIVMVCSVMAVFSACNKRTVDEPTESTETTTEEPATFEEPTGDEIPEVTAENANTTEQNETTTEKKESITNKTETTTARKQESTTQKKAESTTKKQETTTKKKSESTTKKQSETTTKKVESTTKTNSVSEKFTCTSPNHNCTTKEEHEFICSLEAKGCPICGSHSCKSFYAVDEWGNNCYDITRCPKYTEEKDPANCCEYCGRECGIGDNGTCVRFTVDTVCPICGKTVKAKTCHTH